MIFPPPLTKGDTGGFAVGLFVGTQKKRQTIFRLSLFFVSGLCEFLCWVEVYAGPHG